MTTVNLLSETVFGTATGNYNGVATSFSADRQKAVGYYKSSSTSQTIRFRTDEFPGLITLQGTLDADPTEDSDWVDVYVFPGDSAVDGSTVISADYSISLNGNYTWLRANVSSFTSGTILSVTLTH